MKERKASKSSFSGCKPRRKKLDFTDLIGCKIGRLYVEKYIEKKGGSLFLCHCSCGQTVIKKIGDLVASRRKHIRISCGCWQAEIAGERARQNRKLIDYSKVGRKKVKWRLNREGQKLAENNLYIVFSVFRNFKHYHIDLDDVLSAGFISLVSSAYYFLKRDDITCDFLRFASVRISCAMKRCVNRQLRLTDKSLKWKIFQNLHYTITGYKLDDSDLAKLAKMSIFDLRDLLLPSNEIYSLDTLVSQEEDAEDELSDFMVNEQLSPYELLEMKEDIAQEFIKERTYYDRRTERTETNILSELSTISNQGRQ